jgi:hypothetical protein
MPEIADDVRRQARDAHQQQREVRQAIAHHAPVSVQAGLIRGT